MAYAASALAKRGALASYHVPIAVEHAQVQARGRVPWATVPLLREARRRLRPAEVPASAVRRTATCSDLLRVGAARARVPVATQSNLAEWHRRRFDTAVAARLTGSEDKVIAVQGSALATLCRARELRIEAILDATLPHPRFVERLIEQEVGTGRRPVEFGVEVLPRGFAERRLAELATADRVLVPSSFARRTYTAEGFDEARIEVLPLGVDTSLFSPLSGAPTPGAPPSRPSDRAHDGVFRVLFVGRLTRLKGVPYLVDAFAKARIPNAELLLVGDASFADPAWLAVPGVRHQAPVPRYLLPPVFRHADVFVMPSLAESYGLVILEAMASGLPVVVSANSIGPDVVEDGISGYVLAIRDTDALAERLVALVRDGSLRERMGEAAATSAKRFTWSAYETGLTAALSR